MRANQAGRTMAAVMVAAALAGVPVRAANDAATATTATATVRRVIVSLPDRKLAVLADERIVALFDVAIGAPSMPRPIGTFKVEELFN